MIDHTSPVVVTDQDVVVFRKEARWRLGLRVGEGTIRDIEQLAAPLVLKRPHFRAKPLDDAAKSRQPRPRRDVRDGGGTEGLEIAQDQSIQRRVGIERTPKPVLGGRPGRLGALAPDAARRYLDDGEQVANRVGERGRVPVRPAVVQQRAELRKRAWLLDHGSSCLGEDGADLQADQVATEG